jgi:DNA-binding response OmpR family regulator
MTNESGGVVTQLLVVEDELSLRGALSEKLRQEGFQVLEAADGAEGLKVAMDKHPDLILLDIVMPNMDGITALQRLREDAWGQTARVILLTNLNDAESVSEAMTYGVHDFLVKADWQLQDVVTKIRERLKSA